MRVTSTPVVTTLTTLPVTVRRPPSVFPVPPPGRHLVCHGLRDAESQPTHQRPDPARAFEEGDRITALCFLASSARRGHVPWFGGPYGKDPTI